MDRSSDFGDNRVKFQYHKHSHDNELGLFLELSARLWYLLCYPKRHKYSCNFCTCEVNNSDYITLQVLHIKVHCTVI